MEWRKMWVNKTKNYWRSIIKSCLKWVFIRNCRNWTGMWSIKHQVLIRIGMRELDTSKEFNIIGEYGMGITLLMIIRIMWEGLWQNMVCRPLLISIHYLISHLYLMMHLMLKFFLIIRSKVRDSPPLINILMILSIFNLIVLNLLDNKKLRFKIILIIIIFQGWCNPKA